MAVQLPTYVTREEVKRALDIAETARSDAQIDRAISSARDDVNQLCHRRFWNVIATQYWDWPSSQSGYPWRIWLDQRELADVTNQAPVVTSGGNVIPAQDIFWGPANYSPPYTSIELNRSTSASFGQGSTPQRDVAITGLFGYWDNRQPAGTIAASMNTAVTFLTLSDGALAGTGDVLIAGTERMLIQSMGMADTSQAQQGGGCSTAKAADVLLAVVSGAAYSPMEILQLDAEQMLVTSVTGNTLTVKRAFNGTVLATHTGAEVYALRQATVTRGAFGTTAAAHSSGDAAAVQLIPSLVKELALAEAVVHHLQVTAGYAHTGGVPGAAAPVPGGGLADLRNSCRAAHGRMARSRVV